MCEVLADLKSMSCKKLSMVSSFSLHLYNPELLRILCSVVHYCDAGLGINVYCFILAFICSLKSILGSNFKTSRW